MLSHRDHRMCTNYSLVYALFTEVSSWFVSTSTSDRLLTGTFRTELVVAKNMWRHNVKITPLQFNIYVINDTSYPDSSIWNIGIYGRFITPQTVTYRLREFTNRPRRRYAGRPRRRYAGRLRRRYAVRPRRPKVGSN